MSKCHIVENLMHWLNYFLYCLENINKQPEGQLNPSKGEGDVESTRNSRVYPMTFNCDLELESA